MSAPEVFNTPSATLALELQNEIAQAEAYTNNFDPANLAQNRDLQSMVDHLVYHLLVLRRYVYEGRIGADNWERVLRNAPNRCAYAQIQLRLKFDEIAQWRKQEERKKEGRVEEGGEEVAGQVEGG